MFGEIKLAGRIFNNLEHVVDVHENRCVHLKHKRSTCQDCVKSCPTEAIIVGSVRGHIFIDWEKCIACGICVNVCKTEVFRLKQFSDRDLLERGRKIIQSYKKLEIRCTHVDDKTNPAAITINCLGLINPAHIVALAAYGAEEIHFRYANCEKCEAKVGKEQISRNLKASENILESFNLYNDISFSKGELSAVFTQSIEGKQVKEKDEMLSRREFFNYFKQRAKHTATKTITSILDSDYESTKHLPVGESQKYLPVKRQLLLAALRTSHRFDENPLETSESATLTGMDIDPEKCGLCEACARFCPTGALTQETVRDVRGKKIDAELRFNPAQCVKCDLCLDACFTKALKYKDQIEKPFLLDDRDYLLKRR